MADDGLPGRRRDGAATRREAQRVALALFTEQGYDATSLRQIADALGINKASLYYHFPSKEAILRSLFEQRGTEAEDLTAWVEAQPASDGLLERAVLRWVDTFTEDKLQGIRFLRANPNLARTLHATDGRLVGDPLNRLSDRLTAMLRTRGTTDVLLVRMAVLSINAAVEAAAGTGMPDADVTAAARRAARALLAELRQPSTSA
jgi:AcrR family transcriptional regulator